MDKLSKGALNISGIQEEPMGYQEFMKAVEDNGWDVFAGEAILQLDLDIAKAVKEAESGILNKEQVDQLQKAMRDRSKLVRKEIINKNGKKTTKWVRANKDEGKEKPVGKKEGEGSTSGMKTGSYIFSREASVVDTKGNEAKWAQGDAFHFHTEKDGVASVVNLRTTYSDPKKSTHPSYKIKVSELKKLVDSGAMGLYGDDRQIITDMRMYARGGETSSLSDDMKKEFAEAVRQNAILDKESPKVSKLAAHMFDNKYGKTMNEAIRGANDIDEIMSPKQLERAIEVVKELEKPKAAEAPLPDMKFVGTIGDHLVLVRYTEKNGVGWKGAEYSVRFGKNGALEGVSASSKASTNRGAAELQQALKAAGVDKSHFAEDIKKMNDYHEMKATKDAARKARAKAKFPKELEKLFERMYDYAGSTFTPDKIVSMAPYKFKSDDKPDGYLLKFTSRKGIQSAMVADHYIDEAAIAKLTELGKYSTTVKTYKDISSSEA